jgi:hypothetical protein
MTTEEMVVDVSQDFGLRRAAAVYAGALQS